jgi:uncharacterized protein YbaR (Trm112 family)
MGIPSPTRNNMVIPSPNRNNMVIPSPNRNNMVSPSPNRNNMGIPSPNRNNMGIPSPNRNNIVIPPMNNNIYKNPEIIRNNAESSPYRIPNIGITKTLDEDPWIPKNDSTNRNINPSDIKIIAVTPIGTIGKVPTIDTRPTPTPRKLPPTPTRYLKLKVMGEESRIDPLLTTAIYLDLTKPDDRKYNYVSEHMRNIRSCTSQLQKQYHTELMPLINIEGIVKQQMFDKALSIYENNQVYYQDRIDDGLLDISTIKTRLTELEHWFCLIIEPKPKDKEDIESWKEREIFKFRMKITSYCDNELYKYIDPIPVMLLEKIQKYHLKVI